MIKKTLSLVSLAALLSASSTMCYKKNHFDPETIESIPLKGGECENKFSVKDMKSKGYIVKDIKISSGDSGFNYIYIFDKSSENNTAQAKSSGGVYLTKENLREHLKAYQEEEKAKKKEKQKVADIDAGKKIYESVCSTCHGNGTIKAYNLARPLLDLSEKEIKTAFRDYGLGVKDNGMAILMKPYVSKYNYKDIHNISAYLESLKK